MAAELWRPKPQASEGTAMSRFWTRARTLSGEPLATYADFHRWSVEAQRTFWRAWLEDSGIQWTGTAEPVEGSSVYDSPGARFFPDVTLNFAQNLLRYNDTRPALVSVSEARPTQTLTYAELHQKVATVATRLRALGVEPGDRVAGFLPNLPEAVIAMLATTSIGAVWSSCSPDFGAKGVVDRFGQIAPRVLFAANGYRYNGRDFSCLDTLEHVAEEIPSIEHLVVIPYLGEAPVDTESLRDRVTIWDAFVATEPEPLDFTPLPFNHPLYVMYSSGTTGKPKCIVHGAGGTLLQHTKELILHSDLRRGDTIFYFTTCGWMMWNWLVSSLFAGAQVVLFEGSPSHPSLDVLWEQCERLKITHFGTSPKFLGACRSKIEPPQERFDLSALRVIFSTGAPLLPEDFEWVYQSLKSDIQLSSISGGTDIISCFMLGNPTLPVLRGEIQCLGLGMDVAAYKSGAAVLGEQGELVCRNNFPSRPIYFWNDPQHERYRRAYFPSDDDVWVHGDYIEVTGSQGSAGGVVVYGRSDATLNPGGVRIGTAEIYRLVETLPEIDDSIVVGQPWQGDVRVVLFVKLASGTDWAPELADRIRSHIRQGASPRHVPARIVPVPDVPYTISGKKVELAVLQMLRGETPQNIDALKNPEALDAFRDVPELLA